MYKFQFLNYNLQISRSPSLISKVTKSQHLNKKFNFYGQIYFCWFDVYFYGIFENKILVILIHKTIFENTLIPVFIK